MSSARQNKKKSAHAAAKKKTAPAPKQAAAAQAKPEKKPVVASKASPAPAQAKPVAPTRQKPAADPKVAELKKELAGISKQLHGGTLDLVTKVSLAKQKKELERRIADLTGDKPFLTKVPRHKQAA